MSLKSQKTVLVTVVEHCPANHDEWKIASDRKKCQEISDIIFDEESPVYHCVPSYNTKKFYELCAGVRHIAFGYCVEYNIFSKKVQEKNEKRCLNFTDHPCPMYYPSNEIYKYRGCYEFGKIIQADNDHKMTTRKDRIKDTIQETTWEYEEKRLVGNEVKVTIFVATVLTMVFVLALAIILLRKKCAKRGSVNESIDEESSLLKTKVINGYKYVNVPLRSVNDS
ncbi:uncharacterized protein LOC134264309 [Saccostrea cucullata]|uniref:uncharacterized protein LOC134264309 n=1 Tax=Saccostrea cuccullata TaxID=36930 RepID=UPI002ED529BD